MDGTLTRPHHLLSYYLAQVLPPGVRETLTEEGDNIVRRFHQASSIQGLDTGGQNHRAWTPLIT